MITVLTNKKMDSTHRLQQLLALILLPLLFTACKSINRESISIPIDDQITHGRLDNGLSYYIVKNNQPSDRAELRLIVNAGSILEDDDQQGLAHFLEHMAFNGTELYPENEIIDFLQKIGMDFGPDINAYTSFDETVYMISIPSNKEDILSKGLEVLEQWAFFITLDEQDISDERGVVLEEWRLSQGANSRILDRILPVLFENSLYAERLPIGQEKIIQGAKAEAFKRFYHDWYRPDLMALVAVGDFDTSRVEQMIRERFSKHTNPENPRRRELFTVPLPQKNQYLFISDPEVTVTSVDVLHRYNKPELIRTHDYQNILIEQLFYDMFNQRLSEILKTVDTPFITAEAYPSSYTRWTSHSNISTRVEIDNIELSLKSISTEYERLRQYGFLQSELDRSKRQVLQYYEVKWLERNKREHYQYLAAIQEHFLKQTPIPSMDWEWQNIQKLISQIDLEIINQFTDTHLGNTHNTIIIIGPQELDERPITEEEAFAAYHQNGIASDIEPWIDISRDIKLVEKPLPSGSIISEEYDAEAGIYRWILSNNAVVYAKQTDFKTNEILFTSTSPGGFSLVDNDIYIEAMLAASVAQQSKLGNITPLDLEKQLAGKQVNLYPWISEYSEGFQGSASNDDLETLLQLGYLYFTDLNEDESSWTSYKKRLAASLEHQTRDPRVQYQMKLSSVIFNDHFRSQSLNAEDVRNADFLQALTIFRDRFSNAGDFSFFFTGSFDPNELKKLITQWIASLPGNQDLEIPYDRDFNYFTKDITYELEAGIEPLSIITMAWNNDLAWDYDSLYDLTSLSAVLNILLLEKVREQEGGTYSIYSNFLMERVPTGRYLFTIQFSADPDRAYDLIRLIDREIKNIAINGIDESYVQKVAESQRIDYATNLERNAWWLSQMRFLIENNLEWKYALDKENWYNNLQPEDIQNSTSRFLRNARTARVILFPEEE